MKLCALLLALLAAPPQDPPKKDPPKKIDSPSSREFSDALRLAPAWLWADGKPREAARKSLESKNLLDRPLTKAQAQALLDLLAAGNPFLADKTASGTLDVPTGREGETTKVWFQLPPGTRPGKEKPLGLVVALHGGPAPDYKTANATAPQEHSYWTAAAAKQKVILASPAWVGDPTRIVMETIDAVARRWNVDRSRVCLVGHSAGGVGSFMTGVPWCDRFAGIAPFVCGIEHGARLKNAFNFAVYHVLGKKDNEFFLSTGRKNSEALKEAGGPLQVVEKDGGHDVYPDECEKSLAWLAARPRAFWSKDVRWTPDTARASGGFYWIDPAAARPLKAFTAKVSGNEIRIEGGGAAEIVLSDALVDLDTPLVVVVDGETVFEGSVARTMRVALEWVDGRRDFSAVPVARVALGK
jgi:poly(3-hydroxybutyrate) depolymerase